MGESLGLDPQLMLDVLGASSGQSWIVDERMPRAFAGDFAPRAHARILLKDLTLAVGMAQAAGCDTALGEPALKLFRETVERGWGAEDDAVLLRTARERIAERAAGKTP